jgi:3-oxoacyl-[acyl-carrier-protein] synthase II
MAFVRIMLSYV